MSDDILADVNNFLDNPTPATRNTLVPIGVNVIPIGLSVIAERLRRLAMDTIILYVANEREGDHFIQMSGIRWLSALQEVIVHFGTQGSDRLVETLKHPDADMRALAALGLSTLDLQPKTHILLAQAMQRARGTGLQLALAIALAVQGDFKVLERFAVPCLFESCEELSHMINMHKKTHPNFDEEQIKKALLLRAIVPRGLGLVVWDIGTNGLGPQASWLGWRRE